MTPANVTPLPRKPSPLVETEAKLLGAALHLGPTAAVLGALGITAEDFSDELHRKAWQAICRQAEAGIRVTHDTVTLAGTKAGRLTPPEARRIEELAHGNTLDLPTFRLAAEGFRLERLRMRMSSLLAQEVQRLQAGDFDPATLAGRLSAHERELHRSAARLEDLTGDQERLLARWDVNRREGRAEYLPTGIKVLDAEIGGLPRKGLTLLAADAGVGKTAVVDSMLHSMLTLHSSLSAGLISPEDGVEHVPKRWLARETGWVLRDIGSRPLTAEDEVRLQEAAARTHPLLERIFGYRERSITSDQLLALCWQLAERGCGVIGIDNFNKLNLRGGSDDYHERVQRFSDRLSEFAEKARVAVVLLVHLADAEVNTKGKTTGSGGLQGGKALGRDARLRLDLHRKGVELRATIAKANELGEQGTVLQFSRQATAGLIDPDTGEKVDLAQERAIERRAKSAEAEAERDAARKRAKARRDAEKAAEAEAKATTAEAKKQLELEKAAAVEKPKSWGMRFVDAPEREDES
jgi:replicative DNA helicase